MNYFSHYHFDHLPGQDTYNFGLSLPDFVRNFLHGKKLKPLTETQLINSPYPMLAKGTQRHFYRDEVFHGFAFFKTAESHMNSILKPVFTSLGIARYWFAAHIFSEMMIDRVLMKQFPDSLNHFYNDLDTADLMHIEKFLQDAGIEDFESFRLRLKRFIESQYLRQYENNPALIYSLNRVFIYVKAGEEWTKLQYDTLQSTIPEIEAYFLENLNSLTTEMK